MIRKSLVLLSLLSAAPALADAPVRSVSVTGEGKVEVTPDRAILPVAIETHAKTLKDAKQQNDALTDKLLAVAAPFGVGKNKLKTMGLSTAPQYHYEQGSSKQIPDGYQVSRNVELTIDALDQTEKLISALNAAGIDRVQGVRFTLADPKAREAEARKAAMDDAHAKAQALADAAGAKLGPVMTIALSGEGWRPLPPRPMMRAMAAAAALEPPPVLPGEETIQQQVSVVYGLE